MTLRHPVLSERERQSLSWERDSLCIFLVFRERDSLCNSRTNTHDESLWLYSWRVRMSWVCHYTHDECVILLMMMYIYIYIFIILMTMYIYIHIYIHYPNDECVILLMTMYIYIYIYLFYSWRVCPSTHDELLTRHEYDMTYSWRVIVYSYSWRVIMIVQPIADRVAQHLEIISLKNPTNQNSAHGIYD